MIRFILPLTALAVLFASGRVAVAQPARPAAPGDAMVESYLKDAVARIDKRFLDGAKTQAEWEGKRERLKREYFEMLGLLPLPEKTPLNAKVTGTVDRGDVAIDKLHFQSRPGLYVTGNLYRPKANEKKLPAILYVCGHSNRGRDGNKTAFQDHGMWFASNGYVCLIIDTLQLGEVAGKHHGTYNLGRFWWQAMGYTPAGVECWNGVRAIDYLVSRPDVDPEKIGVTGISGGGAATLWIAAADERVKVAVPVSGMSDLESYVNNKIINGHCDCMFMINTYAWEWTTIAALVAPRPLLFANSDADPIFPMDGNNRIIDRLRKAYRLYDKTEMVDEHVSKGGHDYRPDLRVAVFKWMNQHLKKDTGPVKDATATPLPGKDLRVFLDDADLPKDSVNDKIDETFVAKAKVELPEPGKYKEWQAGLLKQLREKCFRDFPERIPAATMGNAISDKDLSWRVVTERGVAARVQWEEGDPKKPVTFVVLGGVDPANDEPPWTEAKFGGDVFLCSPRGFGKLAITYKNPPNYFERAHVLIGRTVDAGRVYDAVSAFRDFHARAKDRTWQVGGRHHAGILAAYAALLEPDMGGVELVEPPSTHRNGPYFLNVLRVMDIPDALGLLAPRPLTIHSNDTAFDRTAEIYKRAGAADKFKRVEVK